MKENRFLFVHIGFLCALAMVLAGCVAYVEDRPRTVYAPPPGTPVPSPVYAPPPPPPEVVVSVTAPGADVEVAIQTESDFYEPLAPLGEWVVVAGYGRCWRPARVEAGWRPYCSGSWRQTDAGWYWVSDEPWAWATYHYGRWDLTAQWGWVWMPQTQWAPAWVGWRSGAGYVGWAPLPPSVRIVVGGAPVFREAEIAPRFVFVEERRLAEPVHRTTVIVNNTTIINQTVNITKVRVTNKIVVNEGPRIEDVERVSGRHVQPVAFRELRHREEAPVIEQRRNLRPREERNAPPPQARPEPGRGVTPLPPAHNAQTEVTHVPPPPAKPVRPEPQKPVRIEKKPATVPVMTAPETKPQPKPVVQPRESRSIQKPVEALKTPEPPSERNSVTEEHRPAAKPAPKEPDRSVRNEKNPEPKPEAVPPAVIKRPAPQAEGKQVERQLKSPKERPADKTRTGKGEERKDGQKNGERKETP